MKINKMKVNQFGNLEDKEIDLDKFNIIYGKNEAGKSTLLSFITSMFYGLSKLKSGKKYTDSEKYKPWRETDFSGTIEYTLDNGKNYKVFRDFNKKSPVIYNDLGEDISKEYSIDKTKGSQFFYEQTKLERETLLSTVITEQKEIEVDQSVQNRLLQKIANLSESGAEETSYKSAIAKLDKLYLDEIGTDRSREKPINITMQNIKKYQVEIEEANSIRDLKYEYEEKRSEIEGKLEEAKARQEKIESEQEKAYQENIEKEKRRVEEDVKRTSGKKIGIALSAILLVLAIALYFPLKNLVISIVLGILAVCVGVFAIVKGKNKVQEEKSDFDNSKMVRDEAENIKKEISRLELELHKLELDQKNIEPKLDKLMQYEESLSAEQEKLEELRKEARIFELTKELMQEAYQEMRQNVTPKFNEHLSKNIEKISNKNYNNIILGDEIKVELKSGELVDIDKLSTGTIEQIYLAMRLSTLDELSKEQMPIILDEAFAYYDDERLEETLSFLSSLGNQIILLTCTNREKEIISKLGISVNFIDI